MADTLQLPDGAGAIDLAEHRFEAGLIRLAVAGGEGHPLDVSDPAVRAAIEAALVADPLRPFDPAALQAHAPAALEALDASAGANELLARVAPIWRPRLLVLAGRSDELTGEEAVVLRFEERLRDLQLAMAEAEAAGDEDRREALHAKYIEIGTSYAGRLAARAR